MKSTVVKSFWNHFSQLSEENRKTAKEKFRLWKNNPWHSSLRFKCVNSPKELWSARVSKNIRAVGIKSNDNEIVWFWIGNHKEYDRLIK